MRYASDWAFDVHTRANGLAEEAIAALGLTPGAVYDAVRSWYRQSPDMVIVEGSMDDGPLPPSETCWLSLHGGSEPGPPLSGGRVYYYLYSVLRSCLKHDVLVDTALELCRHDEGAWRPLASHFLGSLVLIHHDLRQCWYAAAPYAAYWLYELTMHGWRAGPSGRRCERGGRAGRAARQAARRLLRSPGWDADLWVALAACSTSDDSAIALQRASVRVSRAAATYLTSLLAAVGPASDLGVHRARAYGLECAGNALAAASSRFSAPELQWVAGSAGTMPALPAPTHEPQCLERLAQVSGRGGA